MNRRRILSIMRKEWWHITRDMTSFILLLLSPVLMLITMGYAFSIDIKDVAIGVLDQDLSALSRQYVAQITSTDALRLEAWPQSLAEVDGLMMRGEVKAVIVLSRGFERDMWSGKTADLQVVVDGTDPNTAGHAIRHIGTHTENFASQVSGNRLERSGIQLAKASPIDLRLRAWYNPSLRYTVSMIPALVGVVLSVPAMAASLALAREREWGTLEALIATPIGRTELIVGKLIPYMLAGLLSVPLCVATAVYGYNVPFQGSLWLYLLLSLVFLFSTMSIALFLSVYFPLLGIFYVGFADSFQLNGPTDQA
jgi:ABC-2 type transport system permease protein